MRRLTGLLMAVACLSADTRLIQTLKSNYTVLYHRKVPQAESFTQMFTRGNFYGRFRSNTFLYHWQEETPTHKNSLSTGLGGSLLFQSACYGGFDVRTALYYSRGFTTLDHDEAGYMKAGSDIFSRYAYATSGSRELGVLGQAYLRYARGDVVDLRIGRQLVETFYTHSNDTKMIPNTFDGLTFATKVPATDIAFTFAYLTRQKLRGHSNTHALLAYGDPQSGAYTQWLENDDTAMHKGLSVTKLHAAGKSTHAPLLVMDVKTRHKVGLSWQVASYLVPSLLGEVMTQLEYGMQAGAWRITPGIRYIRQFDEGAGAVGGAAYDGTPMGYKDPDSLDGGMLAARVMGSYTRYKVSLGYSQVFDQADLITPWRAFPTAGYTRSMARYNWQANTRSYRIQLEVNPDAKGIYTRPYLQTSILHTDADESKGLYDENYYYVGLIQNLPRDPRLQWRLRVGYADTKQKDADSVDGRFELNYLF